MIDRSTTRDTPIHPMALYLVAMLFGTHIAETILASVHVRAHQQAGHMDASDLIKTLQNHLARRGPFSNRVSLVNGLLLSSVALPGSRFSPRSEASAATSGSKHKRCNVHNGLARCLYVAQGPPAQPPAPSPCRATITSEATLRMYLSETLVRRPQAARTNGMARLSARCCA